VIVNKTNVKKYQWGSNCKAWALLENNKLSIKQEQMPAGSSESLHVHQKAQQFFYVLDGEAAMEIEDEKHHIKPGEGIHVLAGRKHRIMNEAKEDLHFLVISEPTTKEDRTEIC
jgi:mannose-6-phosphate isomerase-like protein (cupin superfamily)